MPGHREGVLAKALQRGADALIIDFEDSVPPDSKVHARAAFTAWVTSVQDGNTEIWVRVNGGSGLLEEDLAAAVAPGVTGIVLPKVASSAAVRDVSATLDAIETSRGVAAGSVRLAPLIETAEGVMAIDELAAAPRISHLAVGEVDLAWDLGMAADGPDMRPEFAPIRLRLVVASAAAGIRPPVGPAWPRLDDADGLRVSTAALRRLGYFGRAAIHPDQIPEIRAVFTPDPSEVTKARRLLELYEEAVARGEGAVLVDGQMIDEAHARSARRLLEEADR